MHRTQKGAECIVAMAQSMTADAAERMRATKPPKGKGNANVQLVLDGLNELGLTNILGVALPDTRNITPKQAEMALDATWSIRQATVAGGNGLLEAIHGAMTKRVEEWYAAPPAPPTSQPPGQPSESSEQAEEPVDGEGGTAELAAPPSVPSSSTGERRASEAPDESGAHERPSVEPPLTAPPKATEGNGARKRSADVQGNSSGKRGCGAAAAPSDVTTSVQHGTRKRGADAQGGSPSKRGRADAAAALQRAGVDLAADAAAAEKTSEFAPSSARAYHQAMREDREEQRAAERAARDADYDGVDPSAERNAAEELERLATVPSGAHLPSDVGCGERGADGCGGDGGVPAPLAIASEQFGPGTSRYYEGYLDETTSPTLQEMADFALSVRYQHYTMNRRKTSDDGGWRWIQPKYEFWVPVVIDEVEHRPVYYWKEGTEFYHAGERAPPLLLRYLDKLNADFGLEGRHKLNSLMFIIDDEGWQHAPPHADGHRTGGFYDLSLSSPGYARELQLLAPDAEPDWSKVGDSQVLARKALAHASLAVLSPGDNGYTDAEGVLHPPKVKHGVPPDRAQPADAWRIGIVGRAITPHPKGKMSGEHFRPIDHVAAARVQLGGDLWNPYTPKHKRAADAAAALQRAGVDPSADADAAEKGSGLVPPSARTRRQKQRLQSQQALAADPVDVGAEAARLRKALAADPVDVGAVEQALTALEGADVTKATLKATGVGKEVVKIKKTDCIPSALCDRATQLIKTLKALL